MAEGVVAGVDWAKDTHEALIADADGERLWAATVTHDEARLSKLCSALRSFNVQRVAIERPDGLLIDRLLDAGLTVLAIHPNQVAATRDRFRAAGGKSDRFDAFVLCELARTDSHRFPALIPDSDQTKALRALTRGREILVEQRVALCNQLRAELERFWPGAIEIFAEIDSPIALAFLERYPSPLDARGLGEKRLAGFLARHGYSGRRAPADLLDRLRATPEGRAAMHETKACRAIMLALIAAIRPIKDPKSVITAATLLAEIGDCRERYPTADALAADAGMTPVAVESGKKKVATSRYGRDKRLRTATSTLADTTRHWHPWAQDRHAATRARRQDHPRAIRGLGRAWCRVIWRCWQDRTPYDPALHHGLQQHITVTIPSSSGPHPDLTATQRMAAATATQPAARTAERKALHSKPTSANTLKG